MKLNTIGSLIKLFFRLTATRGRLLSLAALSAGMILLAAVVRSKTGATWQLYSAYALGALVPIASLVIGSSTFGDLVDDRTLVHLWLRPVSRPAVVVSAWIASLGLVLPFTVGVPAAAMVVAEMPMTTVRTAALSALLGTLTYCAVFVALGLRVRRALAWGLAYILIWEGAMANVGAGLAKLALRQSTRSIAFRSFAGEDIRFPLSTGTAIGVLIIVTGAALVLGTRWLNNAEVS
jgi:ABC-2 type transport system permease protein